MRHTLLTKLTSKDVVATLLVVVFVLFLGAWFRIRLMAAGYEPDYAKDLVGVLEFFLLAIMLWPVIEKNLSYVANLFAPRGLSVRLVATAIAIGVLARIAWWSQILARTSFGMQQNPNLTAMTGPDISFGCPPTQVISLGILVAVLLIPISEELVYRGLLQSYLFKYGAAVSAAGSATIFTLSHRPDSYVFVFAAGLIFGILFWNVRNLWVPIIAHGTYDGLVQLDWRCMRTVWNPSPADLPLIVPGIASTVILLCATAGIVLLTSTRWIRPESRARSNSAL